ncbi:type II secretion system F family protein [Nesterenkonia sp. NBAIMH1]|uniref:type II secretion system F family protein n=1 Tax=Nesterenkonia sp. NBAIMH1 TaxID=2600320 RepID=UPI0011B7F853|nr:type II secretion system F family protein [Nesterenkonia sp. NBAIMH1]
MLAPLLGAALAAGLVLILCSFWVRPPRTGARPRRAGPLRRLLDEAGHSRIQPAAVVVAAFAGALAVFLLVAGITAALPLAGCFALFAAAVPWAALRWQAARRRAQLLDLWPDAVDHIRAGVRSGLSLPESLMRLASEGPDPLRPHFEEFGRDWRAGQTLQTALLRLKGRLADPVADRIVAALQITREVGGNDLGRVLSTLSEFLRDQARTRNELEARQSWTVNGARLAAAAPWAVVLLLSTQPSAAEAYAGAAGTAVLLSGLAVSVVCYRLMLRLGALPQEKRVLA